MLKDRALLSETQIVVAGVALWRMQKAAPGGEARHLQRLKEYEALLPQAVKVLAIW